MPAMVIYRMAQGVITHWPARFSEWMLAGAMTGWGYVLTKPSTVFGSSQAYSQMQQWAQEETWGRVALTLGICRGVALLVNGTFSQTKYAQVSPFIRCGAALGSAFIWFSIWIGLWSSGTDAPGAPVYFFLFCQDVYNARRAVGDAGEAVQARSNGVQ